MNKIKLYHYSDADIKDKLKVSCFGYNAFTDNSVKLSNIKRIYFYTDLLTKEYFFNGCRFLYYTEVKKADLYDINSSKIKVKTDIYREAKKRGFKGVIKDNIAVFFCDIKIKSKTLLTS